MHPVRAAKEKSDNIEPTDVCMMEFQEEERVRGRKFI